MTIRFRNIVATACLASASLVSAQSVTTSFTTIDDGRIQSSGVLGETLFTDGMTVRTSRSGGSNISVGLFEFDLSTIPAGSVITGADILLRTGGLVSQVGTNPAPVSFMAFSGNGMLDLLDFDAVATVLAEVDLRGTGNNADLVIPAGTLAPFQNALDDADPTDFVTLRTETVNFVSFQVDSLETTATDAVPARLRLTYTPVPEPASALLFLIGGLGMLAKRRR